MQYDRQTWNQTYGPLHHATMNAVTKQATEMCKYFNPMLDAMLLSIRSKLTKLDKEKLALRRNCSISVCSFGNDLDKTDGFSNTSHMDMSDGFTDDVKEEILKVLTTFQNEAMFNAEDMNRKELQNEIIYVKKLMEVCDGKNCAPTVIGYDVVTTSMDDANQNECSMKADFVMPGLGVSVRICPRVYHHFYGPAFTHGTALPLTSDAADGGVVLTHGKQFNAFAWGISKPANNVDMREKMYDPKSYDHRKAGSVGEVQRLVRQFRSLF